MYSTLCHSEVKEIYWHLCMYIYIYVNCAKKIEVDINLYTMYMYNIFKNNSWGFEYIVILPRVGP